MIFVKVFSGQSIDMITSRRFAAGHGYIKTAVFGVIDFEVESDDRQGINGWEGNLLQTVFSS